MSEVVKTGFGLALASGVGSKSTTKTSKVMAEQKDLSSPLNHTNYQLQLVHVDSCLVAKLNGLNNVPNAKFRSSFFFCD